MSLNTTAPPRYSGRHRTPENRLTGGISLPGAAAAALTLTATATGAAVIPGIGGTSAAATDSHHQADVAHVAQAIGSTDSAALVALTDHGQMSRSQLDAVAERSRAKVSRDQHRHQLAAAKAEAERWVLPVHDYRFSSPFGRRWGNLHAGDDLAAPIGTRIGSLSSGTVIFAAPQSGYGNKVEVRHWDGTVSWYGHMSRITVKIGDDVAPGDKLGEVGSTGFSTGPHLHLEIHPKGGPAVDPRPWLAERGLKV